MTQQMVVPFKVARFFKDDITSSAEFESSPEVGSSRFFETGIRAGEQISRSEFQRAKTKTAPLHE